MFLWVECRYHNAWETHRTDIAMKKTAILQRPVFDIALAKNARVCDANREWEEVLHLATRRVYPKNSVIPHRELPGMYYVAKGLVVISYTSSCGRERKALYIEAGSLFNEARSLTGYEPGGRFTCIRDVELYVFPEELLRSLDFIRSRPHLVLNLLHTMGAKILIHYSFLADMGTGSHLAHIARFLLGLSAKHGNAEEFKPQVTQQELADLLGIHRATLARSLRQLKQLGVIASFSCRKTWITDMPRLKRLAEG